jgi:4-amino-4-deoxy-L-arabinose transferase-like glycosyltransferase
MLDTRPQSGPRQSSNREFGFVMAGAFFVFSLVSAAKHRGFPALFLPAGSVVFLFCTLAFPRLLTPLNFAWSLLGRLLHRVVSPVILGALYFLILTPFAFVFRAIKKDPLRLILDPAAETYWIKRDDQPGKGMANQF